MNILASYTHSIFQPATSRTGSGQTVASNWQQLSDITDDAGATQKDQRYDFTNMSRRELDELFREGKLDIDFPPLIVPEGGLDLTKDIKAQMDAVYDNKINFIEYYEKSIEFNKSLPTTTINLKKYRTLHSGFERTFGIARKQTFED